MIVIIIVVIAVLVGGFMWFKNTPKRVKAAQAQAQAQIDTKENKATASSYFNINTSSWNEESQEGEAVSPEILKRIELLLALEASATNCAEYLTNPEYTPPSMDEETLLEKHNTLSHPDIPIRKHIQCKIFHALIDAVSGVSTDMELEFVSKNTILIKLSNLLRFKLVKTDVSLDLSPDNMDTFWILRTLFNRSLKDAYLNVLWERNTELTKKFLERYPTIFHKSSITDLSTKHSSILDNYDALLLTVYTLQRLTDHTVCKMSVKDALQEMFKLYESVSVSKYVRYLTVLLRIHVDSCDLTKVFLTKNTLQKMKSIINSDNMLLVSMVEQKLSHVDYIFRYANSTVNPFQDDKIYALCDTLVIYKDSETSPWYAHRNNGFMDGDPIDVSEEVRDRPVVMLRPLFEELLFLINQPLEQSASLRELGALIMANNPMFHELNTKTKIRQDFQKRFPNTTVFEKGKFKGFWFPVDPHVGHLEKLVRTLENDTARPSSTMGDILTKYDTLYVSNFKAMELITDFVHPPVERVNPMVVKETQDVFNTLAIERNLLIGYEPRIEGLPTGDTSDKSIFNSFVTFVKTHSLKMFHNNIGIEDDEEYNANSEMDEDIPNTDTNAEEQEEEESNVNVAEEQQEESNANVVEEEEEQSNVTEEQKEESNADIVEEEEEQSNVTEEQQEESNADVVEEEEEQSNVTEEQEEQSNATDVTEEQQEESNANVAEEKVEEESNANVTEEQQEESNANVTEEQQEESNANVTEEKVEEESNANVTEEQQEESNANVAEEKVEEESNANVTEEQQEESNANVAEEKVEEESNATNITEEQQEESNAANVTEEQEEQSNAANVTEEQQEESNAANVAEEQLEESNADVVEEQEESNADVVEEQQEDNFTNNDVVKTNLLSIPIGPNTNIHTPFRIRMQNSV